MRSSNPSLVLTLILEDIAATEAALGTEAMAAMVDTVATAGMEATADTEAIAAIRQAIVATVAMEATAAICRAIVAMVKLIPAQVAQELAPQKLLLVQQECL